MMQNSKIWLERGFSCLMIIGSLAAIFYLARTVLPDTAITTDEHSYLMQAHQFAAGKLKYPYPGDHLHDYVWHRLSMVICDSEHGWFSRYPPGHALWLVPGVIINAPFVMPMAAAFISLCFLAGTARRLGISRPLILFLFAVSPFFLFIHATLLSHTTAFTAACAMLYGYVRWHSGGVYGWAAFSGLSWSYLYLTRPFTAFLIGVFFGLHAVVTLLVRRRNKDVWIGVACFAGCAGVGIVLNMIYNYIMLGNPFTPPYLFYNPKETLGFGADAMDHTIEKARQHFYDNVILWDHWMWGLPAGTLLLFLLLVLIGWSWVWTPIFLLIFIAFWTGYYFFHYPGPHEIGPGYYFEALPFAMLAAALGFQRLIGGGIRKPVRFLVGLTILIMLPVFMIPFSREQVALLREEFRERTKLYQVLRDAPPNALVIFDHIGVDTIHYDNESMLMYFPKGLNGNPLVFPNFHQGANVLSQLFPDRDVYRLQSDSIETLGVERWTPPEITSPEIAINRFSLGVGKNAVDENGVIYRVAPRDGRAVSGLMAYGIYLLLAPGRYELECDVMVSGDPAQPAMPIVTVDVVGNLGRKVVWKKTVSESGRQVVRGELVLDDFMQIEPRLFYHGRGKVELRSMHLRKLSDGT